MPLATNISCHVELSMVSKRNLPFFSSMLERYNLLSPQEMLAVVANADLASLGSDYALLVAQIRDAFRLSKITLQPNVIRSINKAIQADTFIASRDIMVREVGEQDRVLAQYIIPKIMELNNIYINLAFLNSCPGATGKPNNSIKLAELTI